MRNNRLIIMVGLILSIFLFTTNVDAATNNERKYEITAHMIEDNIPQYNVQVVAKNYQEALETIMNGSMSDEQYNHYAFDNLTKQYEVDNGEVKISSNLSFGKGIKVSEDKAKQIIQILYKTNNAFLGALNNYKKTGQDPDIIFENPSNPRQQITNNEGVTVSKVYEGYTLFVNSQTDNILSIDIKESQDVYVGNSIVNDQVSVNIDSHKKQFDEGYPVNFGQPVKYTIKTSSPKDFILSSTPNFVIDSISVPSEKGTRYTTSIKNKKTLDLTNQEGAISINRNDITSENGSKNIQNAITYVEKELADLDYLFEYKISKDDIPASGEIVIEGRVLGINNQKLPFTYDSGDDIVESKSQVFDIKATENLQGLMVSEIDGKKEVVHYGPMTVSGGVNFAVYDGSTNKLIEESSKYILGYHDEKGNVYTYGLTNDGKLSWNKQDKKYSKDLKISDLNLEKSHLVETGMVTYIDGQQSDIALKPRIWGLNTQENIKRNEALINIRGLAPSDNYFILQYEAPKGYELQKDLVEFKIDEDSISRAQFGNYQINGEIPDKMFRSNEYNALSNLTKGETMKKIYNPYVITLIVTTIIVVTCFFITRLIIKKF